MADYWNTDWLNRSDMFAPLRAVGNRLPGIGWPNCELLNGLADDAGRVVNAQGLARAFRPAGGEIGRLSGRALSRELF